MTDDETTTAAPPSSKSMEQAITDMQKMRGEMTTTLRRMYGPPEWGLASNFEPIIERAGCDGGSRPADGEVAGLPTWATPSVYPRKDWQGAADEVTRIGRKYGFNRVKTVVDRPGDFEIDGRAPDGGQYIFGFGKSAILQITTGCYVWDKKPQGGIPDAPSL